MKLFMHIYGMVALISMCVVGMILTYFSDKYWLAVFPALINVTYIAYTLEHDVTQDTD